MFGIATILMRDTEVMLEVRSDQRLGNGGFVGRLQPGEDRPPGRRRRQMEVPQFLHELGPQLRASVLEDFRAQLLL